MDRNHQRLTLDIGAKNGSATASLRSLLGMFAIAVALSFGSESTIFPPSVATFSDGDRWSSPDAVAGYVGGIAARIHTVDGSPVPGYVVMLMATPGSNATARLYDQSPYTHDYGTDTDTLDSNITAAVTVEAITGTELDRVEFTTAPGGGSSAGLIYAIAYLNMVSDGAFTGGLRVAATGEIGSDGYVGTINGIDEKTAAAHLAEADVLFTPSTPTDEHIDLYGVRHVGELFRARDTGAELADERRLENYRAWGSERPYGMDIVGTRHIADVASYLCGAGSDFACEIVDRLADNVITDDVVSDDDVSDAILSACDDEVATVGAFAMTRSLQ